MPGSMGIGLKYMIAVAMPDAILVAPRGRAQEVKKAVTALKAKGHSQAETLPCDFRPWRWFESLAVGARFQVKRIHVHRARRSACKTTLTVPNTGSSCRARRRSPSMVT
jgi:hypothetical protein